MAVIDVILEVLSDGQWHDKGEISDYVRGKQSGYADSVSRKLREYSEVKNNESKVFFRKGKRMIIKKKANEMRGTSYKLEFMPERSYKNEIMQETLFKVQESPSYERNYDFLKK